MELEQLYMTSISIYLDTLNRRYQTGISREHTYRGDLQTLLMQLLPDILVTNEPARISCGAPDYLLTRKDVPVGYIEAKDIGVDLGSKLLKEQFDRYKAGLSNLIFTDYLDFHFYKDGILTTTVAIAEIKSGKIVSLPENFERFQSLIHNFAQTISQTIKSPTKLAEMMAGKAKLMADVIEKSLQADDEANKRSALKSQMLSFQQMLIHDINNSAFADIYAQTIAYGMFAARYHDPTLPTFSRQEAATLIPRSNPFLRRLFQDIAGYDLDDRLVWIVDELVNIFLATDVADIMRNFGKSTKQEDPVVHFYETFLAAYNPALRKSRGVWYTPQPVVNFIIRAVDDILKTEFNLPQGLADTTKTKIKLKVPTHDKRFAAGLHEYEQEVHKVQILDPATGTGTFLAEVVRHIYKKFEGQQGIWSNYVNQHLIPRLNGFELLMASYAMAHLKMDMLLTETGYKATSDQRFRIFLTNSLEESHADTGTLFSSWLSDEADQANAVKRDTPVMVVIGNPPYSVSSSNKSPWIEKLIADYKKDLNERNIQPLSDDYIKFIRFGQHFIDKNGEGVLAYISNNSFIDGIIHRQMRKHLLESFDKIFILDLHGNTKKKEIGTDKTPDQNVFDIMQGVSINLFIKNPKKSSNGLAEVLHFDLLGKREDKYNFLRDSKLAEIAWKTTSPQSPDYYFATKDYDIEKVYLAGFGIDELWNKVNTGVETGRDDFFVANDVKTLEDRFQNINDKVLTENGIKDLTGFKLATRLKSDMYSHRYIQRYLSKPFDFRFCYYNSKILRRASFEIQKEFIEKVNIGLVCKRGRLLGNSIFSHISITNTITDKNYLADQSYIFPLFVYPKQVSPIAFETTNKPVSNLNPQVARKIAEGIGLEFFPEEKQQMHVDQTDRVFPIDLFDFVYAQLHSNIYRQTYKDLLKIGFPRVAYPVNATDFWRLVILGRDLREIHLLESPLTEQYITQYPVDGNNTVEKLKYDGSRVWINESQYFDNVPKLAWEFYIGGYQPAQKWLKDRKGRELDFEDILHYQKIIVALTETNRLMKEIDEIISE